MSFMDSVKAGDVPTVELALKTEGSFAHEEEGGVSALLWALYYRQDQVAHLIRSYRSTVSIFEAAALGEIETLDGVLGENPGLAKEVSADGFSPLGLAAYFGHLEACQMLLAAGADINRLATGPISAAPLHSALANGFIQVARMLVSAGADTNLAAAGGWRALHYAADLGDADLAMFLVQHGADPSLKSDDGMTAAELGRHVGHDNVSDVLEQP
jgi:ankyrin repeat protein